MNDFDIKMIKKLILKGQLLQNYPNGLMKEQEDINIMNDMCLSVVGN